ncbi:MAG: hypothetical protein DRH04_05735 [Deltaproteobacteria bacterium]|nr:MAG: hypothetical protein DRH04_05735 [Deltaproteobacteria bacterium]
MKNSLREFKDLQKQLVSTRLLFDRATMAREAEKEKAAACLQRAAELKYEANQGGNPVDDILAGREPNYESEQQLQAEAEKQEKLAAVHEQTRRALNDKAGELSQQRQDLEHDLANCREKIIKAAACRYLEGINNKVVVDVVFAAGCFYDRPLCEALAGVPGFMADGEQWRDLHQAAMQRVLKASGAEIIL